MKSIWDDYNKYSLWLDIELAAAESMEKLKIIPKGVVKKVKSKAKINVKRILNIEKKNQNIRDDILEMNNMNPSYTRQAQGDWERQQRDNASAQKT